MAKRAGVVVPISADTSGLVRGVRGAESSLKRFGKFAAIAAGAAALGGLVKTLDVGVRKFVAQEKAVAQTNARLASTGGVARVTAREVIALSDAIADKTGVDDDQILAAQNMLLTFTKIRNEVGKNNDIFNQASQTVVDLSIAFEKDLNSSAIMLGKALNDPVKGVTALGRAGVQFTAQQRKQIDALVESGRILDAQKIILAELETQVGGAGEAFGNTLPGQLSKAKQAFEVIAADLAGLFIPAIARSLRAVTDFLAAFKAAPTLRAKVEVITEPIANAFRRIRDWWSTGERKELPARVILTPPGQRQIAMFFENLQARARASANLAGQNIGREIARGFFGGFGAQTDRSRAAILDKIVKLYRGDYIAEIGVELAKGLWSGFTNEMERLGKSWPDLFKRIIRFYNPQSLGVEIGNLFRGGVEKGARGRRGGAGLANIITAQVRDAIQTARQSLAGAGATIGGLVGEIIGGTSPEAKRLREIRAQQAKENREREEARLRDAISAAASDDERRMAEQDLADFLLDIEAQRLEESIRQNQEAANANIANLVEAFNRGDESAQSFSDKLDAIIGANRGADLGAAFAGAFDRELQTILNTARDIFSVIGTGETIAGATGAGVSTTLKAENERRFQEALADWQKRRDALAQRLERATDSAKDEDSPGGKAITDAEKKGISRIRDLIEKHKTRKPNRGAYGLALGGILKQPTFVAGEAGKEAVIPLESSSAMDILRQAVGGGGGSTQVINLTVNAGLGTNPDELSRVIVDSIKYYERRNGQVFTGPLVPTVRTASGSLVQAASSGPTDFNRISQRRRG